MKLGHKKGNERWGGGSVGRRKRGRGRDGGGEACGFLNSMLVETGSSSSVVISYSL